MSRLSSRSATHLTPVQPTPRRISGKACVSRHRLLQSYQTFASPLVTWCDIPRGLLGYDSRPVVSFSPPARHRPCVLATTQSASVPERGSTQQRRSSLRRHEDLEKHDLRARTRMYLDAEKRLKCASWLSVSSHGLQHRQAQQRRRLRGLCAQLSGLHRSNNGSQSPRIGRAGCREPILMLLRHAAPLKHERAKLPSPLLIRPHCLAHQDWSSDISFQQLRRFLGHKARPHAGTGLGGPQRDWIARLRVAALDRNSIRYNLPAALLAPPFHLSPLNQHEDICSSALL